MHPVFRAAAPFLMALALAACGGGGGGGGGTNTPTGPVTSGEGSWLSFTPRTLEVTTYEGESTSFSLTATSVRTFDKPFNVGIVDPSGTISTDVEVYASNAMTYVANLKTATSLTAGTRQINLEVRLCEDSPATCAKPLPGSPWRVPLKVTVNSTDDAAKRMTFSTQSLDVVAYRGESAVIKFDGAFKFGPNFKQAYISIVDQGKLSTALVEGSPENFKVAVTTSPDLPEGEYNSKLEVRMCYDYLVCKSPVIGSPWIVPLKLTVKKAINLTPLIRLPGVGAWSTYQGGAAHTGYVDASLDVSKFSIRFNIPANAPTRTPNTTATDNGNVYMVYSDIGAPTYQGPAELRSINEADGTLAWSASLGTVAYVNSPAVGNGFVFVTTTTYSQDTLWVFNQQDGTLAYKGTMGSNTETHYAPTVAGSDMFLLGRYFDGFRVGKFSSSNLTDRWQQAFPDTRVYNPYNPAADANNVYVYMKDQLSALDINSGLLSWSVPDVDDKPTSAKSVALSGNLAIVMGARIAAFDVTQRSRVWSVENNFAGALAVGNDMVYAMSATSGALEARSVADGKLQWTTEKLYLGGYTSLVATRNLAIVSGGVKTLAIDLATHKVVWTYLRGGELSISRNGVLYILEPNGYLTGINLQ